MAFASRAIQLPFHSAIAAKRSLSQASASCSSADELVAEGFRQYLLQRVPGGRRTLPPARRQPIQFLPKILRRLQLRDAEGLQEMLFLRQGDGSTRPSSRWRGNPP